MRSLCTLSLLVLPVLAYAGEGPLVIAHRGASGYLPEHTLEAYAMAYAMGADYIEPDLVRTKDGHFIALHDIHLESTSNVEEIYPERKREDGRWYAADFTLEEIKKLRAEERLDKRFPKGTSSFEIPTFEEIIELVQGLNQTMGKSVGIYPELKAPAWHAENGLAMEETFFDILKRYDYTGPEARVFVQCFEPEALKRLRLELGSEAAQIQLIGQDNLLSPKALDEVKTYAEGIGPDKRRIEKNPELVALAHERGLKVHLYTLRSDAVPSHYATFEEELSEFFVRFGVDGAFTDHPDAVRNFLNKQ